MRETTVQRLHTKWQETEKKYQKNRAILMRPHAGQFGTPVLTPEEVAAHAKGPELKKARDDAYLAYAEAQKQLKGE